MKIRIAGIIEESVVDGPGIRSVFFAQGCPRSCCGCHNPDTIDPSGGKLVEEAELLGVVEKTRLIQGVTFSGGEPFLQAQAFARLGRQIKEKGLNIMTYTGYTWEELLKISRLDNYFSDLLSVSDFLVDGPFIEAQKDISLPFRGSKNQRIIDVKRSLLGNNVVVASFS